MKTFIKDLKINDRIESVFLLKKKEMCVCEIWKALKSPQNLTSHHLKVLKDFGLISSRKEGLKVFYKLNKNTLKKHARDGILKIITKKPVRPLRQEMLDNPRSRSAKLRVGERL